MADHPNLAIWLLCAQLLGAQLSAGQSRGAEVSEHTPTFQLAEIEHPGLLEVHQAITGVNPEGFRLSLFRRPDGKVMGVFELSRRPELLDTTRGPALTPENLPTRQTLRTDGSISWAEFPLWDGDGEGLDSDLRDLMQAESVEVTFYLEGGGYKSTRFRLDGLAAAAADAYGIPARVSAARRQEARAMRQLLEEFAQRCTALKKKRREACITAVRACNEDSAGSQSGDGRVEALRECLARIPTS
jgi:hypothetical protein